jgi:DNA-binding transcriptional ArsR family regulator
MYLVQLNDCLIVILIITEIFIPVNSFFKISHATNKKNHDILVLVYLLGGNTMNERQHLPHLHDMSEEELVEHIPSVETIAAVSEAMKQLGDPSRLRIFWLLCHAEECVQNIASAMDMSSPAVSHHLRLLKSAGLIVSNRKGKEMFYRAADTDLVASLHHGIEQIASISCMD